MHHGAGTWSGRRGGGGALTACLPACFSLALWLFVCFFACLSAWMPVSHPLSVHLSHKKEKSGQKSYYKTQLPAQTSAGNQQPTCCIARALVSTRKKACLSWFNSSRRLITMAATSVFPKPVGKYTSEFRSDSITLRKSSTW